MPRRQKNVIAFVVCNQESKTILVPDHPTLHQVKLIGQRITIAPVTHQLAVPQHGVQTAPQRLHTRLVMDIEQRLHVSAINRPVSLGNYLKNQLAAGNGLFVTCRLTAGVRITPT